MFLRVLRLSDVTTADGLQLHPDIFSDQFLLTGPKSRLRWPRQQQPPADSWTAWKKALRKAFLRDRLGRLTDLALLHPLGPWTVNSDLQWPAYFSPSTTFLYCRRSVVSYVSYQAPFPRRRPHHFCEFTRQPADLPQDAVPATFSMIPQGFLDAQWSTAFHPPPMRRPTDVRPASLSRSSQLLKKHLTQWELDLFHHQSRLVDTDTLRQCSGSLQFSVNAKHFHGDVAFGWSVAFGNVVVWAGHGLVPTGKTTPDITTAYLAGTYAAVHLCSCLSVRGPYTAVLSSKIAIAALNKIHAPQLLRRNTLSAHFEWIA